MTGPSPNPWVRDLLSKSPRTFRAKDDVALVFSKIFEATGRISSRLRAFESLLAHGLPDDYYSNYVPAIQAVGAASAPSIS